MKKLLFMAAVAAFMGITTSCSQEDDLNVSSGIENNTIAFSTVSNNPATRSGWTTTSLNNFIVTAVNADKTIHFRSVEYIRSSNGAFTSATPYYWSQSGVLDFYAINSPGTISFDGNNVPSYTYTNWAGETDLVTATVVGGREKNPYPLTFKHITSGIFVSAEAEDKTTERSYNITEIQLTAPCNGTYCYPDTTGGPGSWNISPDTEKTYSYKGNVLPSSFSQNGKLSLSGIFWNILPLKTGTLKFKIGYQVLDKGKVIADYTGDNAKTCVIENPDLKPGYRYTYNFKLTHGTGSEISFSTTISSWQAEGSTDMVPTFNAILSMDFSLPTTFSQLSGKTITLAKAASEDDLRKFLKFDTESGKAAVVEKRNGHLVIVNYDEVFNTITLTDSIHWTFGDYSGDSPVVTAIRMD